jgi:hypothetical protein
MCKALGWAAGHGHLERRRGGFWTWPGVAIKSTGVGWDGKSYEVPDEYVDVGTINALERRGLLSICGDAKITPAGRAALASPTILKETNDG